MKAIFLDRDGVINRKPPEGKYVTSCLDFELLPNVAMALAEFKEAGYEIIIVSNQRGISTGVIKWQDLLNINAMLVDELLKTGIKLLDVYYCPHDFSVHCACRKPKPGMILEASNKYGIDLHNSWMIGDSESDIQAGQRAGCQTVWITTATDSCFETQANVYAPDLLSAARLICSDTFPQQF